MLVRFIVTNYLSYHEEKEFNMLAGNSLKTHKNHVFETGKADLLKVTAIYGANGAGKSNLVYSLNIFKQFILGSTKAKYVYENKFKLSTPGNNEPVSFEIEVFLNKKFYSYGVSLNDSGIIKEWLYESGITSTDKMIFERSISKSKKTSIKVAPKYSSTPKSKLLIELLENRWLANDEPLVCKADELNIPEIITFKKWVNDGIIIITPGSKFLFLIPMIANSPDFKNFTNSILNTFDTGADSLEIEKTDYDKFFGAEDEKTKKDFLSKLESNSGVFTDSHVGLVLVSKEKEKLIVTKVNSLHKNIFGDNINFNLDQESDGTKRLLDFMPTFYYLLKENVTFVIDEIDQSIHPALLKMLLKKFLSAENLKGQLIFTTHESNLLDLKLLRQDEIWFAEKNKKTKATELYSLNDFKPRNDLDIRKGYLNGRFGAIPFLGNLEDLNWNDYV